MPGHGRGGDGNFGTGGLGEIAADRGKAGRATGGRCRIIPTIVEEREHSKDDHACNEKTWI